VHGIDDDRQTEIYMDELRAMFLALLLPLSPLHTYSFFMSREQNAEHHHNIKKGTKSSENVAKFMYLSTTLNKTKLNM
jgi:hypothetical protein